MCRTRGILIQHHQQAREESLRSIRYSAKQGVNKGEQCTVGGAMHCALPRQSVRTVGQDWCREASEGTQGILQCAASLCTQNVSGECLLLSDITCPGSQPPSLPRSQPASLPTWAAGRHGPAPADRWSLWAAPAPGVAASGRAPHRPRGSACWQGRAGIRKGGHCSRSACGKGMGAACASCAALRCRTEPQLAEGQQQASNCMAAHLGGFRGDVGSGPVLAHVKEAKGAQVGILQVTHPAARKAVEGAAPFSNDNGTQSLAPCKARGSSCQAGPAVTWAAASSRSGRRAAAARRPARPRPPWRIAP